MTYSTQEPIILIQHSVAAKQRKVPNEEYNTQVQTHCL